MVELEDVLLGNERRLFKIFFKCLPLIERSVTGLGYNSQCHAFTMGQFPALNDLKIVVFSNTLVCTIFPRFVLKLANIPHLFHYAYI